MKILFLHLSDAHLKEDTKIYDVNPNAIISSLAQIEKFDECVLIFSGDIVYSGSINEYKTAGSFIGRLVKGISEKYIDKKHINVYMVPGNHDVLAKDPERGSDAIKSYYTDRKVDEHYYNELSQLTNFYTFANRNRCFEKARNIEVKRLAFGKFIVKINLINTAPFSLLGSDNGDKGLHYLPEKEFDKFDFNYHESYTISVMHHGPEWFSDKNKNALYEKMYVSSDLIFVGHEHFSLSEKKEINGNKKVSISSGLALYGTKTEHGFNALILNTDKHYLRGFKFTYNGSIYKPSPKPTLVNDDIIFKGKYKFTFTDKFKRLLESDIDQRSGEYYLDYFVFPSLEAKNISGELKNYNVTTEERFMELLNIKNRISIEGNSKCGKTILAKYLCLKLIDNYIPIFLDESDFGIKDNKNIIKNALNEEYGEQADFDEFVQLELHKKVLIVDGNNKINKDKWNMFFEEINGIFGKIILLNGIDWNIDIKKKALEELVEDKFFYMRICPFYYSKREELIIKICKQQQENKYVDYMEKAKKINEEITNQIKYFQLNPDFIHQFVDYYLNFTYTKTQNESNVFSKVFEANVIFRLAQNTEEENVSETLIALDFVAYHIHINKKYPLPLEEFMNAVEKYNKKYDNNLNDKKIFDVAIKSNIIKQISDGFSIEFSDENLLAYFTAAHLNRMFTEGEGQAELDYILDNICFGINGDIILFLSYITSNVQILNPIMISTINHMQEWIEFSIDEENIAYLTQVSAPIKATLPDIKDKKKLAEEKTEMEKEMIEQHKPKAENLYSYDESNVDSFGNKIAKSIHYLELVCKVLTNFRHILTGEQKQKIVKILYTYPNKLLYFMLKDIDENLEVVIDEVLRKYPKTHTGQLITKDILIKSLQNQSLSYILSIFDFVASTATNEKTITDFNKFNYEQNTNYKLQNIMMEENVGGLFTFISKAEQLYDNTDLNITKQMITMVIRKFFLNHEVTIKGEAQRIVDKFFDSSEKKDLQIVQARSRFTKK